jgi:hypothetical protein
LYVSFFSRFSIVLLLGLNFSWPSQAIIVNKATMLQRFIQVTPEAGEISHVEARQVMQNILEFVSAPSTSTGGQGQLNLMLVMQVFEQ